MITYERILEELKRRAEHQPERTQALALYLDLLHAQSRAAVGSCEFPELALDAPRHLQKGLPILSPDNFHADPAAVAFLCDQICAIIADHHPDHTPALNAIRRWIEQEWRFILGIVAEYLRDEGFRKGEVTRVHGSDFPSHASNARENGGLVGSLLAFVLNQALHPFLRKCAKTFAPLVDDSVWYRPFCPICGGKPDFAALEEKGARRLLCSRCDFEWSFWRTTCPFCGCDDPAMERHDTVGDDAHWLYICARCQHTLRTINLRAVAGECLLPVERILAAPLEVPLDVGAPRAMAR